VNVADRYAQAGRVHLRVPRVTLPRRVILGVDPGVASCGWGVVEQTGRKLAAIAWGCIATTPDKDDYGPRLLQIHAELLRVITTTMPDVAAYEHPWLGGKHPPSALLLGRVVGVVEMLCADCDVPLTHYAPTEVKLATTGRGLAIKPDVGRMVQTILGMDAMPTPDHAADALAVAITHAMRT
jgi:crossover junction endodeoxyribonuclease RuvC